MDPVPGGFEVKFFWKLLQNHLELDLQHIFNVSCDSGGDLMTISGKNKYISMQNLSSSLSQLTPFVFN